MKKMLLIVLIPLFIACSPTDNKNHLDDVYFEEDENQIIFEIINDVNDLYNFNPIIQWTAIKNNRYDSSYGGGNTIGLHIKESRILTISLEEYRLKFTYNTEFPYADKSFNLSNNTMLDRNPNDYILQRLTDQYSFTITELLENQMTIIGELYNKETNETYILTLILHEVTV